MKFTENKLYELIDDTQKRIDNVLKYIEEHPNSDPNAYEMNDLMFRVADLGQKGRFFESKPYDFIHDEKYSELGESFYKMMNIRIKQFSYKQYGLGDSKDDPLYKYFIKSMRTMATLNSLGDKNVRDVHSKICGIALYTKQRRRDIKDNSEIIYDNKAEMEELIEDIQSYGVNPFLKDELKALLKDIMQSYGKTFEEYNQSNSKQKSIEKSKQLIEKTEEERDDNDEQSL